MTEREKRLFGDIAATVGCEGMELHDRTLVLEPNAMRGVMRDLIRQQRRFDPEATAWAVSKIVEARFSELQRLHGWRVRIARREMNSLRLARRW